MEASRALLNKALLLLFVGVFVSSCASKTSQPASVGVPEGPSTQSSLESFVQGLNFMRDNPSEREDERVQRFLWLDQWVKILGENGRLNDDLAVELSNDLKSFLVEPEMSQGSLERIIARSETTLGKNIAYYQTYLSVLKGNSVDRALSFLGFIQEDGFTGLYEKAQNLLRLQSVQAMTESRKIGVLIPLSGEFKSFGQQVAQAVQVVSSLAVSEGVEFVLMDSGSTDDELLEGFQKLVLRENVAVVIGPITAKASEFIFERAQILGVPVISLAPRENLETYGPYAFRSALTLKDQIQGIASFAANKMRAKKVGMLFPDSQYGWDAAKIAETSFPRAGLTIEEIQVYDSGATDFKEPLQKMTRLDFPKLRVDEVCPKEVAPKNEEEAAKVSVDSVQQNCVPSLKDLPPLLDFEILFVPDFANTVGLMLPTFPFLRIYGVQVIGLSGLNDPKLISRGQQHAEGVIFTDGFSVDSSDVQSRFFVDRFKSMHQKAPTKMSAEAFDVASLLVDMMRSSDQLISRNYVFSRLRNLRGFEGVTGKIFSDGYQIRKEARLFIVRDGKVERFQ